MPLVTAADLVIAIQLMQEGLLQALGFAVEELVGVAGAKRLGSPHALAAAVDDFLKLVHHDRGGPATAQDVKVPANCSKI